MSTNNNTNFDLPVPKVVIPRDVYTKIMWWVAKATPSECSGLGKTIVEGDTIKVVDAWMVKQKNSGATTDMDDEAIAQLLYEKREVPGNMNFWWHSHANMDVFWSGTDKQQISKIAHNGMCVAIVFNNAKKARGCIAINAPVPMHIDDVKITVEEPYTTDITKAWDAEFDAAVEKPKWGQHQNRHHSSSYYGYHSDYYDGWERVYGDTALTSRSIGFKSGDDMALPFKGTKLEGRVADEDPTVARNKRVKEIDEQIDKLEDFMADAIRTTPSNVPLEIKRILGMAHIVIDDPHQQFQITAGRETSFYECAFEKQIELDEELSILLGKKTLAQKPVEVRQ